MRYKLHYLFAYLNIWLRFVSALSPEVLHVVSNHCAESRKKAPPIRTARNNLGLRGLTDWSSLTGICLETLSLLEYPHPMRLYTYRGENASPSN